MFCVDAKIRGPAQFSAWAPIHTRASAVPTQVSGLQCIPGSVLQLRFVLLAASPPGGCLGSNSYPGQCCPDPSVWSPVHARVSAAAAIRVVGCVTPGRLSGLHFIPGPVLQLRSSWLLLGGCVPPGRLSGLQFIPGPVLSRPKCLVSSAYPGQCCSCDLCGVGCILPGRLSGLRPGSSYPGDVLPGIL